MIHVNNPAVQAAKLQIANAMMSSDIDILSPEGLLAYFSDKLGSIRSDIQSIMSSQDARNAKAKVLSNAEAVLAKYAEKDVKANTPEFDEVKAAAEQIAKILGPDSAEGKEVMAIVNKATASVDGTPGFDKEADADKYVSEHSGAIKWRTVTGQWVILPGDAQFEKGDINSIVQHSKSYRDTLSADGQMDSLRMQQLTSNLSQQFQLISNIIHSFDEGRKNAIGNMR